MSAQETGFLKNNLSAYCCPKCGGDLVFSETLLTCAACGQAYPITDGIPQLFWPNEWDETTSDVTEKMKAFYEQTPFPDYDEFDDVNSLINKAKQGLFARMLDTQIPYGARIVECGCGTGQLTNFLSVANRTVFGADMCMNSLRLGKDFKMGNQLNNAFFSQMNLFRPCFKPGQFDLVISNGVLHHTSDPLLAFKRISTLVKPRGYILIGLYHTWGRLATDLRRIIFNVTRNKLKLLDPRLLSKSVSDAKKNAWFKDQYKNPHESKHTVGEVWKWLDEAEFDFIHSIPSTRLGGRFVESMGLFDPERKGSWIERMLRSIHLIFTGPKEGGFFTVIGKKKP